MSIVCLSYCKNLFRNFDIKLYTLLIINGISSVKYVNIICVLSSINSHNDWYHQ